MARVRAMAVDLGGRAVLMMPDREDWKIVATRSRNAAEWILKRVFARVLKEVAKVHYV